MIGRGKRGRLGLSMVEVMIAISVLAFVLLAFLSVIQSSATLSASSRQTSIAAFQLHAALEATFAIPYDDFLEAYDPTTVTDVDDPDHIVGAGSWAGHLGSRPNGASPSRVPDYCQNIKTVEAKPGGKSNNYTWNPVGGWVPEDDLPLLNQHMRIEWVSQDTASPPGWVEYRLTLTWTNHKNQTQTDSIVTRRSR